MNEPKNDSNTTLQDLKDEITTFQNERGWVDFKPRDLAISIMLEAAELLEHFQWGDDQNIDDAKREKIMHEFGDTLNYMLTLAATMGFDVTTALSEKLELVRAKYPTTIFKAGKQHDVEKYQAIKASYRKKEQA